MSEVIDFILHAEDHLREFIAAYGLLVYALLFAIVFCETGLVVTPFLPGDSLLFAVGALSAQGLIAVEVVLPLLLAAAVLGDAVNYTIGAWMGPKVFHRPSGWLLRKDYLMKAHAFYERYGGRAIILARFVPIVRTFAPFVAGVGKMTYRRFFAYNVIGAVLWVGLFVGGGFLFGNLPMVRSNMKVVILGIIVVSVLPILWEMAKARWGSRRLESE